ncbi:hypothetical protein [Thiobacillus sp.]
MEIIKILVVLAASACSIIMLGAFFWVCCLAATGRLTKKQADCPTSGE